MKKFTDLFILIFSILAFAAAGAGQITENPSRFPSDNQNDLRSDYYGRKSFSLDDDPQYAALKRESEALKNSQSSLNGEIKALNLQIQDKESQIKAFEKSINDCKNTPKEGCLDLVEEWERKKNELAAAVLEIKRQVEAKNAEVQKLNERIAAKNTEIQKRADFLNVKIKEFNQLGFERGGNDGQRDGFDLSQRLGRESGRRDGATTGEYDGRRDGENRSRKQGFDEGAVIGKSEAEAKGKTFGINDGTKEGNAIAALREGDTDGRREAQKSDANLVGQKAGEADGVKRAENEGKTNGEKQGEAEAVKKYETQKIKEIEEFGAFSGAFSDGVPGFPENYNGGANFRPDAPTAESRLFAIAFSDGYRFGYHRAARSSYERNIERIYYAEFKAARLEAYEYYSNLSYPEERRAGFDEGRATTYNLIYPDIYKEFFDLNRDKFSLNPGRDAPEYVSNYESRRQEIYNKIYDEIRAENYRITEQQTFDANIARQTEIFRARRFEYISSIYENYPVLKFVSAEMFENGVSGIAKGDGIFQPGEEIVESLTLVNYGKKAAAQTAVTFGGGQTFVVKNIAPQTLVKIKGFGKSLIPLNTQASTDFVENLTVRPVLNGDSQVQGRYFDDVSQGILAKRELRVRVEYPLRISGVKSASQLILNRQNQLSGELRNFSRKNLAGIIEIELFDNANSKTIIKNWSSVGDLTPDQRILLTNAEISVTNSLDTYVPLQIGARIKKDGVVVGYQENILTVFAKSPYQISSDSRPVIVTDSEAAGGKLFSTINALGGRSKVAIMDLSLTAQPVEIAQNGIVGQTIILLEDEQKNIAAEAETVLKNSSQTSLLIVSANGDGLSKARSLGWLKNASVLPARISGFGKTDILFVNPLAAPENKSFQAVTQTMPQNLENAQQLNRMLQMPADDHLSKIKESFDKNGYFAPTAEQRLLAETFNVKMLGEILNVNNAFRLSGDKNKNLPKLVESDKTLLINRLLAFVEQTPVTPETLGIHLFAVNAIYTLDKAMNKYAPTKTNFSRSVESVVDKIRKAIEAKYKKTLKQNFQNVYEQVYKNEGAFTPFEMGS